MTHQPSAFSYQTAQSLLVSRAIQKILMMTLASFSCRVPECWNYQFDCSGHMPPHKNVIRKTEQLRSKLSEAS